MAQKRMFSPDIVGSDAFIEMPVSVQALYFHLGMRADDDGFVNPQIIMRMIGANADDLKVLIGKRFVLPFESGVIVIKHWRVNNFVRKDRYKETMYFEEKKQLRVKENGVYTLDVSQGKPIKKVPWKSDQEMRLTNGQPKRNATVNAGKVRLGKDRIGKLPSGDKSPAETEKVLSPTHELVNYYYEVKSWDDMDAEFYKENNISYARDSKRAKELIDLCEGSLEKAKTMVDRAAKWADGRGLEWTIETIFKRYLELDSNTLT